MDQHNDEREPTVGGPIAVLLVDDDPTVLDAQALRLEREGFSITTADGADAALRELQGRAFDVAVTDLVMPHPEPDGADEETGLWLLRRIKGNPEWAGTEVIILTGYGAEASAAQAMRLGAFTYVDKSPQGEAILPQMIRHAGVRSRTYAINALLWERLKNALAIVHGCAPYAAQDPEFLKAVRIHARRASALAHLSELTARQAAERPTLVTSPCTWVSLLEGVGATLEALAENNGAVLEIAPPCAAEIDADVEAIQNCLSYLTADVREGVAHSALRLESKCEAGSLVVALTDDGDPIAQDRPGPAGLPAVHTIVEAHGGRIEYQPAGPEACGNRFTISLPLRA